MVWSPSTQYQPVSLSSGACKLFESFSLANRLFRGIWGFCTTPKLVSEDGETLRTILSSSDLSPD